MICQWATNRFRPSELTKHHPRCPLTERSGNGSCHRVGNLSEDFEVSILELESDSDNSDIDSEHSGYKECCKVKYRALLDSCFHSQK